MEKEPDSTSDDPTKISFKLLKEITNDFDPERKLGFGASAEVYKGVFEHGKVIAVKNLHSVHLSGNKQYENEFEHLKRLKHPNIVQLVGFCDEEEYELVQFEDKMVHAEYMRRALCLEYVPNGSLGKYLSEKHRKLNWHTRFRIIQGTCQGLKYLHELFIIHFDLKPDNILLDEKMIPKIADFGISRILGSEENTVMTKTPLGTIGYLPPEFIKRQVISRAYDIFSLGVIMKRIVTGMDYSSISLMEDLECIEHVHNIWRARLQDLPAYASVEIDCKQVKTCIEIALDCMQEDPRKRPEMNEITYRLSNVENKENDSEFHNGQFFLPDPERLSPELVAGDKPMVRSEKEKHNRTKKNRSHLYTSKLPLEFLCEITEDFSMERIVSTPAFATVFKGILHSGEELAVKRFSGSCRAPPDDEFQKKIDNLMEVEHENVLRLIGFCCERKRKVLRHNGRYILTDEVEPYMCYEYAQNGSLDKYIYEKSCLDWNTRFKIIMGVCEGLHFLHTELDVPILRTPLAPEDILLDSNMVSKLSDIGVANLIHMPCASSMDYDLRDTGYVAPAEARGLTPFCQKSEYMPPECFEHGGISLQSDIYSLGLLIMQIATGEENDPSLANRSGKMLIHNVRHLEDIDMASKYPSLDTTCIGQLKLCIETGLRCTEFNKMKRPSIQEIVKTLKSAYLGSRVYEDITSSSTSSRSKLMNSLRHELCCYQSQTGARPILLSVLPRRLCFPLRPKRLTSCLLYLTNNTEDHIAFQLFTKTPKRYHTKLPLCSIVPPKCTCTLSVTMHKQKKKLLSNNEEFLVLQGSIAREGDIKNVDPASVIAFFNKAKNKTNHDVQEMMLPVVCNAREETTSDKAMQLAEIIARQNCRAVLSVDVHPTRQRRPGGINLLFRKYQTSQSCRSLLSVDVHPKEPWILTSNNCGTVCIWNYQKQKLVKSFDVGKDKPVYSAKFIKRKDWLVAGDGDGYIHVCSYSTMEEVWNLKAHENHIMSLAVNPTYPFVLSASDDHMIKLWDWNKGWECIQKFEGHDNTVTQVMFHLKNGINFASASLDRRIKIWNIFSGNCNITLGEHPNGLLCIHYFEDRQLHYVRQLLIVVSADGAAKVWDPETHCCVGKLEGHTNSLNALCWLPEQGVLVTGSLDGTVQIWEPTGTTYRPENIVGLNLGAVNALAYIKESRRVVVGCEEGIAMVKIN